MTWWQKWFSGFNTTGNFPTRKPINPTLGYDPLTGEIDSPQFLTEMEREGFYFNDKRVWWERVWTTWTPYQVWHGDSDTSIERRYPHLKEVLEVYKFDSGAKRWKYMIVRPEYLGGAGGGGHGEGAYIWEGDAGEKE